MDLNDVFGSKAGVKRGKAQYVLFPADQPL